MKRSQAWLNSSYSQNTFTRISMLPVMVRTGPVRVEGPPAQKNEKGEKFFVAGQSVVGGKEVAG